MRRTRILSRAEGSRSLAAAGTQSALATRSARYIDDPRPLVVLCDAANTTVQRILEKAGSVEPAFAERYLRAIDTELARQILDYYGRERVNFDPPLDRASARVGFFGQTVRVSAAHRGIRLTWTWTDRSASH